jgi:dTDP-4-dehydrorhamnose 3,5-epimerase
MDKIAKIIQGGQYEDSRGKLIFFNDFDMKDVRRFYMIEHPDTSIVRAWQAHKKEQKWFYVIEGCFKVVIVKPEQWQHTSKKSVPQEFILKIGKNQLLHIPGGFANGFKALEPYSKLMIFSDFAISDSGTDDYRFDKNLWYNWE